MVELSDIPIIDFHCHFPNRNISYLLATNEYGALETVLPMSVVDDLRKVESGSVQGDELKYLRQRVEENEHKYKISSLRQMFREQYTSIPSYRDFMRYVSKAIGCESKLEIIDKHVSKKIKDNLRGYISSVLDRENISKVVLDLFGGKEVSPDFPKGRSYWIFRVTKLTLPNTYKEEGIETIDQMIDFIDGEMNEAVKKGCSGFKFVQAISRPLDIERVSEKQAQQAFKDLLEVKPDFCLLCVMPYYDDSSMRRKLKIFQDFLLKHMIIKAGQLELPFLFHTGAEGVSGRIPDLRVVNPTHFYTSLCSLRDEDFLRTKIVMLHCGYPFFREAAIMASQFSNLYIETSIPGFFYHGDYPEIYKVFMESIPIQKILYGSDTYGTPELFGYNVWRQRTVLSEVLEGFKHRHGWTEEDCLQAARRILNENAKALLKV